MTTQWGKQCPLNPGQHIQPNELAVPCTAGYLTPAIRVLSIQSTQPWPAGQPKEQATESKWAFSAAGLFVLGTFKIFDKSVNDLCKLKVTSTYSVRLKKARRLRH